MTISNVIDRTGFVVGPLPLFDEHGRPALSVRIKATYLITPNGELKSSPKQVPLCDTGEPDPIDPSTSYKYEPETALAKNATDVALIGHAHAPKSQTRVIDVGLKVGPVQKIVRVFGERQWIKQGGRLFITKPQPFERMPLVYERAFGGWDKGDKEEKNWTFEPRNPVGLGFGDPLRFVQDGQVPMPNLEDPNHLIERPGDRPPPAAFGFTSPHWQPRAQYAGTYDEKWDRERKPLLPEDFDRRFFSAASPGLIAPGYLRGDEDVVIVNASVRSQLRFKLPSVPPPVCSVELRRGKTQVLQSNLDTVIIDTDEDLVFLIWRAVVPIPTGPHDVAAITVERRESASQVATA